MLVLEPKFLISEFYIHQKRHDNIGQSHNSNNFTFRVPGNSVSSA